MSRPGVEIERLSKSFGPVKALNDISLRIARGEFFSLLGPSGCGKTTLLRVIAGLEVPESGELRLGGVSMIEVPPQGRPVNTVFQNYALFPHLKVFENVAFGLRMKKVPEKAITERVQRALELVHIADLASRLPNQISGGQKQRVALARALVNEPEVLLLDEPLAAIDAKLRAELQAELRSLQRQLGTTFVYVTHDQEEALALSDRVAVLRTGRIEQIGTAKEVYERPRNRFVASFVGACNVLDAQIVGTRADRTLLETPLGRLEVCGAPPSSAHVCVGIRREHVILEGSGANTFRGRIQDVAFNGAHSVYEISAGGVVLQAARTNASGVLGFYDEITFQLPPQSLLFLEG